MVSYSLIGLDAIRLQKLNGQWTIVVLRGRNLRPEKMILSTQNTKTEAFNNNDCTLVLLAIVYIMNFTFSKEDIDVPNPENCNMQVMKNLIPSFILQKCKPVQASDFFNIFFRWVGVRTIQSKKFSYLSNYDKQARYFFDFLSILDFMVYVEINANTW